MIFPLLQGILSLRRAPITWLLIALNTVVLLYGWAVAGDSSDRLDRMMGEDFFIETQGRLYSKFLADNAAFAPELVRELASASDTDPKRFKLLGHLAFRDEKFMARPDQEIVFADEVALASWKKRAKEIRAMEEDHPSFFLGISTDAMNFAQWITYIFTHSSGVHYFGNMLFLLIFGAALEEMIGGLGLLVIFVMTGVSAAGFYLVLSGPSTAPLVGASGAISGVMAMFAVLRWNKPARFLYWFFLPIRNSIGLVYLPAGACLAVWLLGDLAGYLGNIDMLGGVAHAAHLGGEFAGALAGMTLLLLRRGRGAPTPPEPTMWKLQPLIQSR